MQNNFIELENSINYKFNNISLLKLALTHPSYANENNIEKYKTNQRLEYLGDAILEFVVSDFLYKNFITYVEGELTKLRSKIVCEDSLAIIGKKLNLNKYLLVGNGEIYKKTNMNQSVIADTLEAIIGAIYIDSNINFASDFIHKFVLIMDIINKQSKDFKSKLQIIVNEKKLPIKYNLLYEKGPDHNKEFCIEVCINEKVYGIGIGKSKKEAEQKAAENSLKKFNGVIKCI